jgi:hypothetical protein
MGKCAILISALLVVLLSPVALAAAFINSPELYAGPGEWYEPFPYQRNALIGFDSDPHTWPGDPKNTSAFDLQPAVNYDLEGIEDPLWYESDWLKIDGVYSWEPVSPTGAGQGILIFDNSQGTGDMTASLTWHLDNSTERNHKKNIWSELVWLQTSANSGLDIQLIPEPGYALTSLYLPVGPNPLGGGWLVADGYGRIEPNPTWEELVLNIKVAPGDQFMIDSWHTATECVPEPGTAALFLCGLVGLSISRRRRTV